MKISIDKWYGFQLKYGMVFNRYIQIALIAAVLFAFSFNLIYYTVEVKQYILDVLFFLIIISFIFYKSKGQFTLGQFFLSGLIGAVAVWFSNVSVLVLASVGLWMAVSVLKKRSIQGIIGYLVMGAIWLGSFMFYYWFFIRNHPHNNLQVDAFQSINYLPGASDFMGTVKWVLANLRGLFEFGIGRTGGIIGIILSLTAFLFIYRRKDYVLLILCLPVMIHLVLSLFSIYPFGRRFTLYIIPVVFIYMSYGLYHLFKFTKLTSILIPVFLILIVYDNAKRSREPIMKEEIREPMEYIGKHYQEGDIIYVQYGSKWAFEYYRDQYITDDCEIMLGSWIRTQPAEFEKELTILKEYNRIWVLFSHYYPIEKEMVMEGCNKYKDCIDEYQHHAASAYLYFKKSGNTDFSDLEGHAILAYPESRHLKDIDLSLDFQSADPVYWAKRNYKRVEKLTGRNVDILPDDAIGCLMDSWVIASTWGG